MIGYDFNGVVDTDRFIPTQEDVIITGITVNGGLALPTLQWLGEHNIYCVVYFDPYPNGANNVIVSGNWKAEMINKLKLKKYYEDDPTQYNIIKNLAPECEIIKV